MSKKKVSKKVSKKVVTKPVQEKVTVKVYQDGTNYKIGNAGKEVEMLLSEVLSFEKAVSESEKVQAILKKYYLS